MGVGATTLLIVAAVSALSEPRPKWLFPEHPCRAVFTVPRVAGSHTLVAIPQADRGPGEGFAACDALGGPLPLRVAYTDGTNVHVLVQLGAEGKRGPCVLYCGGQGATAAPAAEPDPQPVGVELYPVSGTSMPNSWSKMLYLCRRYGRPVETVWFEGFGDLNLSSRLDGTEGVRPSVRPPAGRRAYRQGLARSIAVSHTILLCPEEGLYRFALDCDDVGFLLVDGRLAVALADRYDAPGWLAGDPVRLGAGLHAVDVYACATDRLQLGVGWSLPSAGPSAAIQPIPRTNLLSACEVFDVRVERMDRALQPDFAYELLPAYSFRGYPVTFAPVRLQNTSEDWTASPMRCRWWVDGRAAGPDGGSVVAVLTGAREHLARMEVRDDLGFSGSCQRTLDARLVPSREYAFDVEVALLPAVCYGNDVVEPSLRLYGRIPDSARFQVAWDVQRKTGAAETKERAAGLAGTPVAVPLVRDTAGSLSEIRWRVGHEGEILRSGVIRFAAPPFEDVPVAVSGSALIGSDGTQLVLVPWDRGDRYAQPPLDPRSVRAGVVCVDDMLAASGMESADGAARFDRVLERWMAGVSTNRLRYVRLPEPDTSSAAYVPLLKLVQAPAALPAGEDVVVLSAGLRDIVRQLDPEIFERHLAALCDILSASRKRRIVLVTPPPFPSDADSVRPFALAVRKVADARGIPVADLYTAFRCADAERGALLRSSDFVLSRLGHQVAARVLYRTLLGEPPDESKGRGVAVGKP